MNEIVEKHQENPFSHGEASPILTAGHPCHTKSQGSKQHRRNQQRRFGAMGVLRLIVCGGSNRSKNVPLNAGEPRIARIDTNLHELNAGISRQECQEAKSAKNKYQNQKIFSWRSWLLGTLGASLWFGFVKIRVNSC